MEDEDWIKTIAIGGVLSLLGVLIVPTILVYGYIVRAIRERAEGATEPPQFEEWGDLFVEGLQAWVIGIVYMLIPIIVAAVTVGGSIAAMASGSRAGTSVGMAGLFGGLLITFVLSLVFGYIAVAAIVHFACTGELSAAFDLGTLRRLALSSDYATPWLVSVVIFIAASVVVGVLNVIPGLGAVIGAFVFFYTGIVAADLWAGGYNAALEESDETGSVGTAPV